MNSINYKHLQYFWVVAKEGSIARAGEILHLTPQTISGQLGILEDSIGVKLFSRAGRRLVLTEAGRAALTYADEIFLLGAELQEVLASRPVDKPLKFSIGITEVIPKLIAYRLLKPAFSLAEPVRIVCHEDKLDSLLADMATHKLDMILTDSPIRSTANVRAFNHLLGECGITFFGIPDLARRYRDGFPQSLRGAPMLLPTRETAVRGALMQWFDELQFSPQVMGEFDDSALMKTFGQAGIGVFPAPSVIEKEVIRQYKVERIGQTDKVREQFYAVSMERKLKHPAVVAISKAARQKVFRNTSLEN